MNTPQNPYAPDPIELEIRKISEKVDEVTRNGADLREQATVLQAAVRSLRHFRAKLLVSALIVAFIAGAGTSAVLLSVYVTPHVVIQTLRSLKK